MTSRLTREVLRAHQDEDLLVTFVYGTLRPGEGNYWIEDAVIRVIEDATTPGVMYASGIPFCDFKSTQGVITGTVLIMDRHHDDTAAMIQMEVGAGYKPMDVPVTLPGHKNSTVTALAWHYPRADRFRPFMRVESGNYKDHPSSSAYRRAHPPKKTKTKSDDRRESRQSYRNWWDDVTS